jgi:hypothetical protein
LHSGPQKNGEDAIGSPGADDGGQDSNPARTRRSPAGGEQGRGLGSTRVRFVGLVRGEGLPVGVDRSARRRSPLELVLQRGGCSVGHVSEMASNSRCKRGWRAL